MKFQIYRTIEGLHGARLGIAKFKTINVNADEVSGRKIALRRAIKRWDGKLTAIPSGWEKILIESHVELITEPGSIPA